MLAASIEWETIEYNLDALARCLTTWDVARWLQLKLALFELNSTAQIYRPPIASVAGHQQGIPGKLATLVAKLVFQDDTDSTGLVSLVSTTAQHIWAMHASSPNDADSTLPASQAVALAQQIMKSGMLENLPKYMDDLADSLSVTASSLFICIAVLQLAFAVARLWPGGVMKTPAAGALAAPTAQLAVAVLQCASSDNSLQQQPIVLGAALWTLQMVRYMHDKLPCELGRVLEQDNHVKDLQLAAGFWLLLMLALIAQLHNHKQQCQPQHADNTTATAVQHQVQQFEHNVMQWIGSDIFMLWQQQQCWLQNSSAADLCRTVQMLHRLLTNWAITLQCYCSGDDEDSDDDESLGEIPQQIIEVARSAHRLPFLLLQLASTSWEQHEYALCVSAVSAAAAALQCINAEAANAKCSFDDAMMQTLLQQWLQVAQVILQACSIRSNGGHQASVAAEASNSAAAAATAAVASAAAAASSAPDAAVAPPPDLQQKEQLTMSLLQLLGQIANLTTNCKLSSCWRPYGMPIAAAVEQCIRTPAVTAEKLFQHDAAGTVGLYACLKQLFGHDDTLGPLLHILRHSTASGRKEAVLLYWQVVAILCSTLKRLPPTVHVHLKIITDIPTDIACSSADSDMAIAVQGDCIALMHQALTTMASVWPMVDTQLGDCSSSKLALAQHMPLLFGRVFRARSLQLQSTLNQLTAAGVSSSSSSSSSSASPSRTGSSSSTNSAVHGQAADLNLQDALCKVMASVQATFLTMESVMLVVQQLRRRCIAARIHQVHMQPSECSSSNSIASYVVRPDCMFELRDVIKDLKVLMQRCDKAVSGATIALQMLQQDAEAVGQKSKQGRDQQLENAQQAKAQLTFITPTALRPVLDSMGLARLPDQLVVVADRICALLPVSCCCNNPSCSNLSGRSERQLVWGKSCICAGCKTARYCSRSCQAQHWKQHRSICDALNAAAEETEATDTHGSSCS